MTDRPTPDLDAIVDEVLAQAAPGEDIEVVVGTGTTTSIRAYGGDVEALTVADTAGIGVRVLVDGRQGFASAGSLEADVVAEVLAEARDNMPFAQPDPHVLLAEPDGVESPVGDLFDEAVATTPLDDKVAMALALEQQVREADPRISGVRSASYGDRMSRSVVASTRGIRAAGRSTAASLGALALARDDGETQTGAGSSVGRGPGDLDVSEAAEDAVARATALLGATQPPSRSVTLVLEPRIAASILGIVGGMLSGERVLKGRTPFADRVGESIAVDGLTLIDDPTDLTSYGARRHDGEGLAARPNQLIDGGVLQGFLHNTSTASRAGTRTTASAVRGIRSTPGVGVHAPSVAPGDGSLDDLIGDVSDGLFVHGLSGLHSGVNAVSGDFSVGASGILIRDGKLDAPVREITIASTLPKLLLDIVAIGADVEALPSGMTTPSVSIANVAMSGQ